MVLLLPHGAAKESTAAVYRAFDERDGASGAGERFAALDSALGRVQRARDLAALPANDLASSPLAAELRALGAFRADVSGAGPAVYGLFHHRRTAEAAPQRPRVPRPHLAHRSRVVRVTGSLPFLMSQLPTIEHRQGRFAPVLRQRRSQLILWIIVIEGIPSSSTSSPGGRSCSPPPSRSSPTSR